jgi:hypothetical protein
VIEIRPRSYDEIAQDERVLAWKEAGKPVLSLRKASTQSFFKLALPEKQVLSTAE